MFKPSTAEDNRYTEPILKAITELENTQDSVIQNRVYSELLGFSSGESIGTKETSIILGHTEAIDRLRCLRANYVFSLESEWARRIILNKTEISKLNKIQYFKNYRKMISSEFGFIKRYTSKPIKKIAFIGSGPFPFTSFSLAKEFGVRVINVDIDHEALATSKELAAAYGVQNRMEYICGDARYLELDSSVDVIIVAALVGHHADSKNEIINGFAKKLTDRQILAARTAVGLKQLFYVGIDDSDIDMRCLGVSTPPEEVINSLMVFQKK